MPAESVLATHSALAEMSAHPVSKSSSKEGYTIPRPSKRGLLLVGAQHKQFGQDQ
jgi:hypothetical protein